METITKPPRNLKNHSWSFLRCVYIYIYIYIHTLKTKTLHVNVGKTTNKPLKKMAPPSKIQAPQRRFWNCFGRGIASRPREARLHRVEVVAPHPEGVLQHLPRSVSHILQTPNHGQPIARLVPMLEVSCLQCPYPRTSDTSPQGPCGIQLGHRWESQHGHQEACPEDKVPAWPQVVDESSEASHVSSSFSRSVRHLPGCAVWSWAHPVRGWDDVFAG